MKQIKKVVKCVLEKKPARVLIQAPVGLLKEAQLIGRKLSKRGIESIYSAEPCYGACDLRDRGAAKADCDLLLHLGHADFGVKEAVPTIYWPWQESAEWRKPLQEGFPKLGESIGLVSSANFTHLLPRIKKWLKKKGKECLIYKDGEILGCKLKAATMIEQEVDCFICIGSGAFHSVGLAAKEKKVFGLDLERQELRVIKSELIKKQQKVAIGRAHRVKRWGILLSEKPGQLALNKARMIKERLEKRGKKASLLLMDEITPQKIQFFDFGGWVNCACPRIALDERARFKKPILNPDELKKVFSNQNYII